MTPGGIDRKAIKHPIERRAHLTLLFFAVPFWLLLSGAIVSGILYFLGFLLGFLLALFIGWILIRLLRAYLLGNSVKVTPEQFPEVYRAAEEVKQQFGYDKPLEIYILYSPILNAFATVFRGTRVLVLLSEIVEAFTEEDIRELKYLLGHEIGHIVAGHFSPWARMVFILRWIPVLFKWYSRGCEYTVDRYGYIASGDLHASISAITKLVVGAKLSKKVNLELLRKQAEEVRNIPSGKYAELFSTHPFLVKRIVELERYAKEEKSFAAAGAKDVRVALALLIGAVFIGGAIAFWLMTSSPFALMKLGSDKAKVAAAKGSLETLRKAMEIYMADYGRYPLQLDGLASVDARNRVLVESLGPYVDLTSQFRAFDDEKIALLTVNESEYAIFAAASDTNKTAMMATPSQVVGADGN